MRSYFLILYYFRAWPFTGSPKFWIQSLKRLVSAWVYYPYPVYRSLLFAISLHKSQKRKYTLSPYWYHLDDVCRLLMQDTTRIELLIAAVFHDVLEDTPYKRQDLIRFLRSMGEFDETSIQLILKLVEELTDEYTPQAYPSLNRAKRKEMEAIRKGKMSDEAKAIKLCDITNNSAGIKLSDPGFFEVYRKELLLFLDQFQHLPRYQSVIDQLSMVGESISGSLEEA